MPPQVTQQDRDEHASGPFNTATELPKLVRLFSVVIASVAFTSVDIFFVVIASVAFTSVARKLEPSSLDCAISFSARISLGNKFHHRSMVACPSPATACYY